MAINIQGEYFNPVKELGKMLISAEQQEQIITSWSKALISFKNGFGQIPTPAFHHAYLPPGWNKNDGAYLNQIPVTKIVTGEYDQSWWFGDPLWDDGTGKGNGMFWAPVVEASENDVAPVQPPKPVDVKTLAAERAPARHQPATESNSAKPSIAERLDNLDEKIQKKIVVAAVAVAIILLFVIFG